MDKEISEIAIGLNVKLLVRNVVARLELCLGLFWVELNSKYRPVWALISRNLRVALLVPCQRCGDEHGLHSGVFVKVLIIKPVVVPVPREVVLLEELPLVAEGAEETRCFGGFDEDEGELHTVMRMIMHNFHRSINETSNIIESLARAPHHEAPSRLVKAHRLLEDGAAEIVVVFCPGAAARVENATEVLHLAKCLGHVTAEDERNAAGAC